jgi:hypothetical protein
MLAGSIAASKLVGTDIATVGALSSGSIAAGFGSIATANPITTTNATASTTTGTGAVIVTGGVGIGGALNVGGAAKVASLTGTATNDNAPAGAVGEEINASASAVSLVSTTAKTIATLSLTAGDWEVEARVKFNYAATTTSTWRAAGISLTTNVMPTTLTDTTALAIQSGAITTALTGPALPTGAARESLAGSTNIFCVAQSTFATSTATADCLIRARRVR